MSAMPGHVARTPEFAALDAALNANPRYFLDAYKGAKTLPDLIDEAVTQGIITQATKEHISEHWQTPWPATNDVLKRGLYWSCRLSLFESGDLTLPRPTPRPIATTWICGLPKQTFEVVNIVSAHQVTMIILTPGSHEYPPSGQGNQPVWTTQSKDAKVDPGETQVEVNGQTRTVRPQY